MRHERLAEGPGVRRRRTTSWIPGISGAVLLLCGFGTQPEAATNTATEWLRIFDLLCVATRLSEDSLRAQVSLLEEAAESIPDETLRMLSPNNTAGYLVTGRDGSLVITTMGLTRAGSLSSRSCSVLLQSVSFEDAAEVIADNFPLKVLDQFTQGINQFMIFQGYLAGYPESMAISVQSVGEMTSVSIFEMPES